MLKPQNTKGKVLYPILRKKIRFSLVINLKNVNNTAGREKGGGGEGDVGDLSQDRM